MDESKHRQDNELTEGGQWMFIELLGHKRLAGYVSEVEKWGQVLMRVDIPTIIDFENKRLKYTTQFYGTHALYCATPISQSDAIHLSKMLRPNPYDKFDLHREANNNLDDYDDGQDLDIPF